MDDAKQSQIDVMASGLIDHRNRIARDLRNMADEIEGLEPQHDLRDLAVYYGPMAADMLHKVTWGFSNLNLDHFARRAAELDRVIAVAVHEGATDGAA